MIAIVIMGVIWREWRHLAMILKGQFFLRKGKEKIKEVFSGSGA